MAMFIRRTPAAPQSPPPGNVVLVVPDGKRPVGIDPELFEDIVGVRMLDGQRAGGHVGVDEAPAEGVGAPPVQPRGEQPAQPKKDAAASTEDKKNSTPDIWASTLALALFVIGLIVAVIAFGTEKGPTYTAAEGIGAFALFYIVAQAAERFVEMAMPYLEHIPKFGKDQFEADRDEAVVKANDPGERAARASELADAANAEKAKTPEEDAANKEARVQQRRADRAAIVFGATAAIGMMLCGYLEADFLSAVGVDLPPPGTGTSTTTLSQVIAMASTGLIVGGGSKALHDLIGNISKSSAAKDTPAETGGAK